MIRQYLIRSLGYYRRSHLCVTLGVLVSTAILTGSLMVGDSVRYSMDRIVVNRLGRAEFALGGGDRLFGEDLASRLRAGTAPLLQTKGIAVSRGGEYRYNDVQVAGVDGRFGALGGTALFDSLGAGEAVINSVLAERLHLRPGDEFLLRFQRLEYIPRDAPLALDADVTMSRRFTVRSIAGLDAFGGYNLKTDQITPHTVFLSLGELQRLMELEGRANVILAASLPETPLTLDSLERQLRSAWTIADAGCELLRLDRPGFYELRSKRIFLDAAVERAAREADPAAEPVFSYFVNSIGRGARATPYSFAAAAAGLFSPGLRGDQAVINDWLARDIGAAAGDEITVTYYVLGPARTLVEDTTTFTVREVVPLVGRWADRSLMPDFPGLSDEESCRDWNPGIPVDLDRIRDKDEAYWERYKGTPKLFIGMSAAKRLWSNRFGSLTAVRFRTDDPAALTAALNRALDPADLGFLFQPVREQGLRASRDSVDFGQLFLGLSFFVIVAALLLTGLLFVFTIESRSEETGLFLALGLPSRLIRRLMLSEGAILAGIGAILGAVAGVFVNRGILLTLQTVWRGIVGTSALAGQIRPLTVLTGTAAGFLMALLTLWLMSRRLLNMPAAALQQGGGRFSGGLKTSSRASLITGIVSTAGLALILLLGDPSRGNAAFGLFFTAGVLCISGGLAWLQLLLRALSGRRHTVIPDPAATGLRNAARNRARSTAFAALLAGGIFIVFTVGANRKSALTHAELRGSGTGGFALVGESAMPVLEDLNTPAGKKKYGLETLSDSVSFVQFRMKEGDDASCLNLNRIARPQLLGVDTKGLTARGAFTMAQTAGGVDPARPWEILNRDLGPDVVPGIADLTVIVWGLGMSVGDTLWYADEQGRQFGVKLMAGIANSVMQGNLILSEDAFLERYPSISGYRFFLADVPSGESEQVSAFLSRQLQDEGLDLVPAPERLAAFNNIENTYLSIFLILGTFGLIIGSIGILIVVWRNVNERRGEMALMRAVGFSRPLLQGYVLSEHLALLAAGIVLGTVAALFSTMPTLMTPGASVPWGTVVLLLAVVTANGAFWTVIAVSRALRGEPLAGLRTE